jgi:AGCS family alanine or glycine:cation symporter
MPDIEALIRTLNGLAWGPAMLVLLLGMGVYLTLGLRFLTLRRLPRAIGLLLGGRAGRGDGDISPFSALMTSLSATIGTGQHRRCRYGGGDGRARSPLFWMWITALVGMATKYAEAVLRRALSRAWTVNGNHVRRADVLHPQRARCELGTGWPPPSRSSACLAGFGIGTAVQANSVAQVLSDAYAVPPLVTGLALMVLVGAVILGGIRRIATVASYLVPLMASSYLLMGLIVVLLHLDQVPAALGTIVDAAFSGAAAAGGFAGATIWAAVRFGVARGVFSNEAGLGSAPIAHAAARTEQPVEQGMIAMLGTFIDTLVVCTMTGLVIVIMDVLPSGVSGASLTSMAFAAAFPGGDIIVSLGLCLFAFTTIIGWSFYGERCVVFLFGTRAILPFRIAWVIAVPVGTVVKLDLVWLLADTLNAFMAVPNLIALALLGPLVFRLSRDYFRKPA